MRSIDTMHLSRDFMCHQVSAQEINAVIVAEVAAHVDTTTVDMPYDPPSTYGKCLPKDPAAYERTWLATIRAYGLHVWFRQQWLNWEGNEGAPKLTPTTTPAIVLGSNPSAVLNGSDTTSYLGRTYAWIRRHPDFFHSGDIFTPESEPANAGIQPYCHAPCMFASRAVAEQWYRDSMTVDRAAFHSLGVDVKVGYWGLACSQDLVSQATAQAMGVYVTDCYQRTPSTLVSRLTALHDRYGIPVVLGEWGDIWDSGGAVSQEIDNTFATLRTLPFLAGVNYWQGYGELASGDGLIDHTTLTLNPAGKRIAFWFS
jgi:hypothetical protein